MKICIDAGHNYSKCDTGATGNGLKEEVVTFEIADALNNYLTGVGIETVMTRPTLKAILGYDVNSSLNNRVKIANDSNCDLFVSIHCNSSDNTSAWGTETIIDGRGGDAEKLANLIQSNVVKRLKTTDRGVRVDDEYLGYNLAVLHKTKMPAVLIETAFISNEKNALLLKNNAKDFAFAIFLALCDYLDVDEHIEIKELESVNDIVWELQHRGIITNPTLWLAKLKTDNNAYWLARKCVNYMIKNN